MHLGNTKLLNAISANFDPMFVRMSGARVVVKKTKKKQINKVSARINSQRLGSVFFRNGALTGNNSKVMAENSKRPTHLSQIFITTLHLLSLKSPFPFGAVLKNDLLKTVGA